MEKNEKKWTEDQVVKAFSHFLNPASGSSPEEAEAGLRSYLREMDTESFGAGDIHSVAERLTSSRCSGQLAGKVIEKLNESVSSIPTR